MNNTSTIAFSLIIGFIVFITVRGELPAYLCVLGIGGNNCPAPNTTPLTTTSVTQGTPSSSSSSSSSSNLSIGSSSLTSNGGLNTSTSLSGIDGSIGDDNGEELIPPQYGTGTPVLLNYGGNSSDYGNTSGTTPDPNSIDQGLSTESDDGYEDE